MRTLVTVATAALLLGCSSNGDTSNTGAGAGTTATGSGGATTTGGGNATAGGGPADGGETGTGGAGGHGGAQATCPEPGHPVPDPLVDPDGGCPPGFISPTDALCQAPPDTSCDLYCDHQCHRRCKTDADCPDPCRPHCSVQPMANGSDYCGDFGWRGGPWYCGPVEGNRCLWEDDSGYMCGITP